MGARGAWIKVSAIDGTTHEYLPDIQVTFLNAVDSGQGFSASGEPRRAMVPSHANFTVQVRSPGYRPSEPLRVGPLAPGEKQELTVPLQRQ
jgi:hypothetical protein